MQNFDKLTDRHGTGCLKYDFALERGKPSGLVPLWVADMDFPTAPCVQEALGQAVRHGIFGYSEAKKDYYDALINWFQTRHGFTINPSWVVKTPGVVYALAAAVRSLTSPGDAVLLLSPVYYPFYEVIRDNGRKLVESPLVYKDGRYTIDFEDLEGKITEEKVRLMLFCSPHNPVGRVWSKEELEKVNAITGRHSVLVVSDEIHCDFTWGEHIHHVFPLSDRLVICTSPSKSFNLAGLQISNILIPDRALRKKMLKEKDRTGYSQSGTLGLVACKAAYEKGGPWLDELKRYIWQNFLYLKEGLPDGIRLVEPEGTYLGWMDCSALGLSAEALEDFMVSRARLWLDGGSMFGSASALFQRINVACPRPTLEKAVSKLASARKELI